MSKLNYYASPTSSNNAGLTPYDCLTVTVRRSRGHHHRPGSADLTDQELLQTAWLPTGPFPGDIQELMNLLDLSSVLVNTVFGTLNRTSELSNTEIETGDEKKKQKINIGKLLSSTGFLGVSIIINFEVYFFLMFMFVFSFTVVVTVVMAVLSYLVLPGGVTKSLRRRRQIVELFRIMDHDSSGVSCIPLLLNMHF